MLEFNFDYDLVQSQKLLLTPQIKEAVSILNMGSEELFRYVEGQLELNPVIDFSGYADKLKKVSDPDEIAAWENDADALDDSQDENGQEEYISPSEAAERLTLKEYMLIQLHSHNISGDKLRIGEYLIDNIDENGYLKSSPSEAARYFKRTISEVMEVLELLQSFDPPGICSRNLKECLSTQLKQMGCEDSDVYMVIEGHLGDLASNRIRKISVQTGIKKERLKEIFELIKGLEPKPGRDFYPKAEPRIQTPDIIIRDINGFYKPLINEDAYPSININSFYLQLARASTAEEAGKYLQSKINNALWLIKCIERRKTMLLNIAGCIIETNRDFLIYGKKYIKPVSIEWIAERLNIHKSIIEKTINSKFLLCLWGVFEFEEFFDV